MIGKDEGYRRLMVWQKAHELAMEVYVATKGFPKEEMFGITSQMRRATLSVPANIVEGYARSSQKEKLQFYTIARGSLTELEYFIDFSTEFGYLSEEQHQKLKTSREEVGRLLHGFIKSLKI